MKIKGMRTWPVLLLCLPAFVAVWGGWVGMGAMTGFGVINMLPGMVPDGGWATLNTAITLPIGLETYAAFALHSYAGAHTPELRRFAGRSAVLALALGGLGQLAFHLMQAAGVVHAPWMITAVVATIPVAVLGAGTRLAALIRSDNEAKRTELDDGGPGFVEYDDVEAPEPAESATRAVESMLAPIDLDDIDRDSVRAAVERTIERKPRAGKEEQRKAVGMLLDGQSVADVATATGVGRSVVGRFATVLSRLRDDPLATDFGSATGKVHPELVAVMRDAMKMGRAL